MILSPEKLKKILVPHNMTEIDFATAMSESKKKNIPLDLVLVDRGFVQDSVLGKIIADEMGYDFLDIKKSQVLKIDPKILNYIPE